MNGLTKKAIGRGVRGIDAMKIHIGLALHCVNGGTQDG